MTDLNKPVKITHDPETGDISSIEKVEQKWDEEDRMADARERDDYWWDQRVSAELNHQKQLEADKAAQSRQWREEAMESPEEYMARTNQELRDRAIAEEEAAKSMTSEQVAEAYLEDHPSARSKATPPKPSQVHFKPSPEKLKELAESGKTLAKQMKHVGKAAQKTTEAIEKAFPGHLTHRPFHNLELIVLRDELSKNQ